ncbi:MAG: hypothetical protein IKO63_01090 [Paludibacteraceae bacterium]|nr:hypothetical protein [Paludibacteraceae bacterium]
MPENNMQAINLRAAISAANDITITPTDALVETSILKQLIESCKARVEQLEPAAKSLAEHQLAEMGVTSGKFMYHGHHYTLDCVPVFDIIGKPQKYTMPEGVDYRRMAVEKAEYQRQAAKLTPKMKTIMDDFPKDHPNIIPDAITRTLKCLD